MNCFWRFKLQLILDGLHVENCTVMIGTVNSFRHISNFHLEFCLQSKEKID